AAEAVLERVGGRRQPVAQEILEQELPEAAARLRRTEDLVELAELLRLLEELDGRLSDLTELLVDRVRLLGCGLEPSVDLRVEVGEAAVGRLDQGLQPPVHIGVPLFELRAAVGTQRAELAA